MADTETNTTEPEATTTETEATTTEFIRDPILDTEEMRKMFVGGIPTDVTDEEVKEYFENICPDLKVVEFFPIKKDNTKPSIGFVTYEKSEMIDEVLLKRDDIKLKEKNLDVKRAVPKNTTSAGAHEKTKKLFIANLPKLDCSDDELKKYFEQRHPVKYGTIESVQLVKKKDEAGNTTEENKGFGFVMVSSEDMADKMAIQHQNFDFKGRRIELKKSVPNTQGGKRGGRGGRGGGNQNYGAGGYGGYGPGQYGGYGGYDPYSQGYGYGAYDPYAYGYGQYNQGYGGYAPRGGRGGRYQPY